jgi:hypothetical protein
VNPVAVGIVAGVVAGTIVVAISVWGMRRGGHGGKPSSVSQPLIARQGPRFFFLLGLVYLLLLALLAIARSASWPLIRERDLHDPIGNVVEAGLDRQRDPGQDITIQAGHRGVRSAAAPRLHADDGQPARHPRLPAPPNPRPHAVRQPSDLRSQG